MGCCHFEGVEGVVVWMFGAGGSIYLFLVLVGVFVDEIGICGLWFVDIVVREVEVVNCDWRWSSGTRREIVGGTLRRLVFTSETSIE